MHTSLFSKQSINLGRQVEFDWAKVFAIIFMIMVHIYQYVSGIQYHTLPKTPFRNIIEFLGGPLAAPIFMFAMGVGMCYGHRHTPKSFFIRGSKLLVAGYLLNFFREVVPIFFIQLTDYTSSESILYALGNVDILHFAGMAFLAIGLMRYFHLAIWKMLIIAISLQPLGAFLARLPIQNGIIQYLLDLLIYANEGSSFPLTSWLIYPITGMLFATILQHVHDKDHFYVNVLIIGIVGTFVTSITYRLNGYDLRTSYTLARASYWHQTLIQTLWIFFIILIAIAGYYGLSSVVKQPKVNTVIRWISTNLTTIYVCQWLLIDYMIARIIMNLTIHFDPTHVILPSFVIFILALSITYFIQRIQSMNFIETH